MAFNLRGPEVLIVLGLIALAVWLLILRPRSQARQDQSVSHRVAAIQQPVIGAADGLPKVASTDPLDSGLVGYRRADNTFHGTLGTVVQYAMLALNDLKWTVTGTSEMTRTLTFETPVSMGSWSGITVTLSFFEVAPNVWRVSGAGKQNVRGAQLAALDLGGSDRTVNRVLIKMHAVAPALD